MGNKRQREPRAGLLIDAACEPLITALKNPTEKPAIVNFRVTHAGKRNQYGCQSTAEVAPYLSGSSGAFVPGGNSCSKPFITIANVA